MSADLDAALAGQPIAAPTLNVTTPRPCRRHRWFTKYGGAVMRDREDGSYGLVLVPTLMFCEVCGKPKNEARSRRGKQSRNYGNRAELAVSRKYGGTKVGQAGGPVDVRGKDFQTQVKTHRRTPPREWTKAFGAMAAARERCPRLLLRFVMGPGVAPADYFVFPADAFLDWFGRDE